MLFAYFVYIAHLTKFTRGSLLPLENLCPWKNLWEKESSSKLHLAIEMQYFSLEILIHRHWHQEVPLSHWFAFEEARDSVTFFANFQSNLQWNRNLNLLTLGFLSLNFSLVLIRNIVARRKEIEFWCKTKNTVRCSIDNLIWSTNREVKDPQRAYFADSLRATFRTSRNFFPTLFIVCHFLFLSIRKVLYSASSGSSLWARTLRGQKPTSGTYY